MDYAFTGLASLQLSAGSASVLVFGLGILIVYLVLSAQYESYVTPVIILMTVPLAMLGALVFWHCARLTSTSMPRWVW